MTAILVLLLFILTVLLLGASLMYLYRWLVRRKLFPQLPRLWKGQQRGFIICSSAFVVTLAGFLLVGASDGPNGQPQPAGPVPSVQALGPSFDGEPPPKLVPQPPPMAEEDNRVFPAKDVETAGAPGSEVVEVKPVAQASPAQANIAPDLAASAQPAPNQPVPPAPPAAQPTAQTAPPPPPATPAPEPQPQPTAQAEPAPKAQPAAAPEPQAQAKPAAKPKVTPKPKTGPAYTVCAASFRDKQMARNHVRALMKKGLQPQVVSVNLKGMGRWYRVCVGDFIARSDATDKAVAMKKAGQAKTPFVTRLR